MESYYIEIKEDGNTEYARFDKNREEDLFTATAETMDVLGFTPFDERQEYYFNNLSVSFWTDKDTGDNFLLEWEWTGDNLMVLTALAT